MVPELQPARPNGLAALSFFVECKSLYRSSTAARLTAWPSSLRNPNADATSDVALCCGLTDRVTVPLYRDDSDATQPERIAAAHSNAHKAGPWRLSDRGGWGRLNIAPKRRIRRGMNEVDACEICHRNLARMRQFAWLRQSARSAHLDLAQRSAAYCYTSGLDQRSFDL